MRKLRFQENFSKMLGNQWEQIVWHYGFPIFFLTFCCICFTVSSTGLLKTVPFRKNSTFPQPFFETLRVMRIFFSIYQLPPCVWPEERVFSFFWKLIKTPSTPFIANQNRKYFSLKAEACSPAPVIIILWLGCSYYTMSMQMNHWNPGKIFYIWLMQLWTKMGIFFSIIFWKFLNVFPKFIQKFFENLPEVSLKFTKKF